MKAIEIPILLKSDEQIISDYEREKMGEMGGELTATEKFELDDKWFVHSEKCQQVTLYLKSAEEIINWYEAITGYTHFTAADQGWVTPMGVRDFMKLIDSQL